jgi:hypothetical protein
LLKYEVSGAKTVAVFQSEAEEPHPFMVSTLHVTHYVMQRACCLAVNFHIETRSVFLPARSTKSVASGTPQPT